MIFCKDLAGTIEKAVREPKSRTAFQYDISCYFSLNSMAKPPPRAMNTGITLSDVTSCSVIT